MAILVKFRAWKSCKEQSIFWKKKQAELQFIETLAKSRENALLQQVKFRFQTILLLYQLQVQRLESPYFVSQLLQSLDKDWSKSRVLEAFEIIVVRVHNFRKYLLNFLSDKTKLPVFNIGATAIFSKSIMWLDG